MLINRLKKNSKRMANWRKRQTITCYRLYDADIPEFAAAVDIYETEQQRINVVIQEYAPPKSVDPEKAKLRLDTLVAAVSEYLQLPESAVFVKARQRQRGSQQYEKAEAQDKNEWIVREGAARLRVNLNDYLDTGVFLDHRPMRRYVYEHAKGKKVLNLFCYTASVSVQAALGGAEETLSIDMSNTYLDWARRNFLSNKLDKKAHTLNRADCLEWLADPVRKHLKRYDMIFLDPPSFSNSKKMQSVLDIQRDHVKLIRQSMRLIRPDGVLIFSNNLRSFKLDEDALSMYAIENYHKPSLDPDFERNPRIHQCYLIRRPSRK